MLPNERRDALDARLLAAHAAGDRPALAALYREAGEMSERQGKIDAACFFFTHAYVFALELGLDEAEDLHRRLLAHGREE